MSVSSLIALSAAVVMSAGSVGGVDMEYEGEVDIYNGSPIDEESEAAQQKIALADGGMFDQSTQMFIYTVPGGNQSVHSSVANEMITNDMVDISVDKGLSYELYLDGKKVDDPEISSISDPGKYSLVVYGADADHQMLNFTIVPEKTGDISFYKLPLGFDVTGLTVSGKEKEISDVSRVDMSEEGDYVITYHCNVIDLYYSLNVTIDHTAPTLEIEGLKDGSARGPVKIKGVKKSDTLEIKCNGKQFSVPDDNIISPPGKYEVTVVDDAGNSVSKKFEIKFYLNFQGVLFGVILLAVIGAAVGYMVWSRKRLKVR